MKMAPSVLQPPSMLDRHTITPPSVPISKLSPLGLGTGTLLPTMAPTFNPPQVVSPRVVSPRTPTASPPTMMSNTLFNKPQLYKSPQVSPIIWPTYCLFYLHISVTLLSSFLALAERFTIQPIPFKSFTYYITSGEGFKLLIDDTGQWSLMLFPQKSLQLCANSLT